MISIFIIFNRRVMLYPKLTQGNKLPDSSQEPKKHHTLIKIQIEDKTDEILDYICHFKCEGDLAIKWSSKQTNLNHKCMYNSTEKAVKFLQRKREVPTDDWEQIKRFKITAQIIVLPHYYSIKPIANTVSWPNLRDKIKFYEKKFDANNEIEMSSIFIEPFAPISVSSPAFMASIKKLRTTLK